MPSAFALSKRSHPSEDQSSLASVRVTKYRDAYILEDDCAPVNIGSAVLTDGVELQCGPQHTCR